MTQSRQLAAIMFTDIVGYTALMGNDEQKAFELLSKNRQIQKPIIEQFNGRLIKELGDGIMASFNTISDAVNAAIKIQEACNAANAFQLRVGIHQGEVVVDSDDIFGDAVNIASRIQSVAEPGCIFISESVHNNIFNKREISTRFIGEENLKNVNEPVRIYEVMIENSDRPPRAIPARKPPVKSVPERSIAVLPFVNMSGDPTQEYFSEGIAEEIINSLAHLKDLKVAGRTSSSQFKGKNIDLQEVGEKLNVRNVLEGSVRKHGNHLRITAQLISLEDGFHLWSEKYDRNMDDIFAIQDEIALAITEQLQVTLFEKDRALMNRINTQNAVAYELYLKGRFHMNRRGSSVVTGLQFFKEAIAADPSFALAYFGVSFSNMLLAFYSYRRGKDLMTDIRESAKKAIALDISLSEGYFALGAYKVYLEWNWAESKKYHLKSIQIQPNNSQASALYGMHHLGWIEGNFDEAVKYGMSAIKMEPLSAIDHADLAWILYTANRFDEALKIARTGIELDGNSFLSHRVAGLCYLGLNRYDEAIDQMNHLLKISNWNQHAINTLIWAHCCKGNMEEAWRLMLDLEDRSVTEYMAGAHLALSAAYLGDLNRSFQYLERAYDDRDPILTQLKYSPMVPVLLREDERFQKFLERIGFP